MLHGKNRTKGYQETESSIMDLGRMLTLNLSSDILPNTLNKSRVHDPGYSLIRLWSAGELKMKFPVIAWLCCLMDI